MKKDSIADTLTRLAREAKAEAARGSAGRLAASYEKKERKRSGAPNKASEKILREFLARVAAKYPATIGGSKAMIEASELPPETLLARIIMAMNYHPSGLAVCARQDDLSRKGVIEDSDCAKMSVRDMFSHMSRPMLDELEAKILENEAKLTTPAPKVTPDEPFDPESIPSRAARAGEGDSLDDDCELLEGLEIVEKEFPHIGDLSMLTKSILAEKKAPSFEPAQQASEWGSW